jgi:hypothetical protein
MKELASFVSALSSHWVALILGIVSLAMTIALRARGRKPRNKIFWSLAALCLFVACFLAWRDEHGMRDKAEQESARLREELAKAKVQNVPQLSCHIDRVVIGEGSDTKLTQVFVLLTVQNAGDPSIAENYRLHIKASDFEYSAGPAKIPKEYTLTPADKTPKITFLQQESIVEKTGKPVERGGQEQGWLRFTMQAQEVTPEFIRRPGIKYTVSLVDISGKICSADHVTQ